jgi:outer membrane protein assembly factor BamB
MTHSKNHPTHPELMRLIPVTLLAACFAVCENARAQQWVNPNFDTHRMDYRELGYPRQNLIPADDSRITALLSHSNGFIYGATSGKKQSYLFFHNRFINKVRPLGRIGTATGVHHTLLEGPDGTIYIGTGLNMFAHFEFTRDFPVEYDGIEKQLWKDVQAPYQGYEGGRIYRYDPRTGDVQTYTNDDPAPLEDLGIPVPGDSIYAMTFDTESRRIYGITYPNARFFVFDTKTGQSRVIGEFLTSRVYAGPERHWRSVPRALYCDPATGDVYTSGDNGWFVRLPAGGDAFQLTRMRLPGEYWEGQSSYDYPVVESFAVADGKLYASSSDGFLMWLDPAKDGVVVLGKPRDSRRMRAMAAGHDGLLYMVTGEPERISKLHSYDLSGKSGFRELGTFAVDRSPYYAHRAFQVDAMTIGADGTVFCGESDRGGKLFFYIPGPGPFPGDWNPSNPRTIRQRPDDTPGLIGEDL